MSKKQKRILWPVIFVVAFGLSAFAFASVCAPLIFRAGRAKTLPEALGHTSISTTESSGEPVMLPQASYPAFTLTASRTVMRTNGQARVLSLLQRFQRSDGTYKLVQTSYALDGTTERVQTSFGFIGLGVFQLDQARRRLVFIAPQLDDAPTDVERFLREHPLFVRVESVRSVNTVVWRKAGRAEAEFAEEYRAPSLGGLLIKTLKVSKGKRETVEPTRIEMGEPAQSLFIELLLYPVDYSNYERRVQETEKRNAPEAARLMRQLLERMRQIRPGAG